MNENQPSIIDKRKIEVELMEYNTDQFVEILSLFKDFLYHLISYREIKGFINELPGDREFWVYSSDAHLKMATISWCMVFGADSNITHWKNISREEVEIVRKSFKDYLFSITKMCDSDFKKYWSEMTSFRNEYVAHRENYEKPIPCFDMACRIVFCFDSWIRNQIKPDIVDFPDYEKLAEEYRINIQKTLSDILNQQ